MAHVHTLPDPLRTVHIMGVGGTAMAALAGMLVDRGLRVTGSDGGKVYPPMSDYLRGLGIEPMVGFEAKNLAHRPDLVVVGNVVRQSYAEAAALVEGDLPYMSFPELLGSCFLEAGAGEPPRRNLVVSGTHGKTTTTALTAWLLEAAGRSPGFLIGGVAANFDRTARASGGPFFVIEGDEYDTAFFDKGPKFLHYRPTTAIVTSIEFDHADIYRDLEHVASSFRRLLALVPRDGSGCVVARWDDDTVARVVGEELHDQPVEVRRYGPGAEWDGRVDSVDTTTGRMKFTVLRGGKPWGSFESVLVGEHNLYNQVAAAAALDREGMAAADLSAGFASFKGIKRRQEVIGEPAGITVVDDFAHHPTAVRVTLDALRLRFGGRRLWAIFEPRSATSRRSIFQQSYVEAFDAADLVVIARPFDQSAIDDNERFDAGQLVDQLRARGREAFLWGGATGSTDPAAAADEIAAQVAANATPEDVVAVLSNGGFGGLHKKLLAALAGRFGVEAAAQSRT